MAALGAVAGDIYLPSMPDIAAGLDTSRAWVQSTVTATLIGGALGQLVIGPLSDRYGRRGPVLVGIGLHIVASIGIVFTPSIGVLIGLRVIQGIGNASAQVVSMAMVRDLYSGYRAAKLLSQLVLVIGLAPLLAPTLGGFLAELGSWRYTFVFLAAFGVALGLFVYWRVPDTRPDTIKQNPAGLGQAFQAYWVLLHDYRFMGYAVIPGLAMSTMMAWVISSPFIVQVHYGQPSRVFGLIFAFCGLFMVAGAQVNAAVVHRFAPKRLLTVVLPIELGFALAGLAAALANWGSLWTLVPGVAVLVFANGFVPANASALALTRHGEAAGAAAAMISCVQSICAASVTGLLSTIGDTPRDMTAVQSGALAIALLIVVCGWLLGRRSQAAGRPSA
jgi:DHA1 family bicyclomycin/chloramphenicol resistance-like MFS transporter